MAPETLDEREFELINIIRLKSGINQRDLSRHMDLSLGMINMLMRRLVAKGYIRVKQLNKRKAEYILTPKGFMEKMKKSVKYTINTINAIGMIKGRLKEILAELYERGERDFYILGGSDLAALVEIALKESCSDGYRVSSVKTIPSEKVQGTFLICKEEYENGTANKENSINLVEELARGERGLTDKREF